MTIHPVPKKTKKRKHKKGLSDSTLSKLWRDRVLKEYGNKCIICGGHGPLECHHIVHRSVKVLFWDWMNGVPVCSPRETGNNCHKYADTIKGREEVALKIGIIKYSHIKEMELVTLKDYLIENDLSNNEWREKIKDELSIK